MIPRSYQQNLIIILSLISSVLPAPPSHFICMSQILYSFILYFSMYLFRKELFKSATILLIIHFKMCLILSDIQLVFWNEEGVQAKEKYSGRYVSWNLAVTQIIAKCW